jgi:hypothetical protein
MNRVYHIVHPTTQIRPSNIPNAGNGVFAVAVPDERYVVYKKDEQITTYPGEIIDEETKNKRYPGDVDATYVIQINDDIPHEYLDPTDEIYKDHHGHYINSPPFNTPPNVEFRNITGTKIVEIVALRNIIHNEELYVKYGNGPLVNGCQYEDGNCQAPSSPPYQAVSSPPSPLSPLSPPSPPPVRRKRLFKVKKQHQDLEYYNLDNQGNEINTKVIIDLTSDND